MLKAPQQLLDRTRGAYYKGEEVLVKYGSTSTKAIIVELLGGDRYKVCVTAWNYCMEVDINQVQKIELERSKYNVNNIDKGWNSLVSSSFYDDTDVKSLPSPKWKAWKYSSPKFSKIQSPKRASHFDFNNTKPKSPMDSLIKNLITMIDSPTIDRRPKSPLSNFPRNYMGNRKMRSPTGTRPNAFLNTSHGPLFTKEQLYPLHHNLNVSPVDHSYDLGQLRQSTTVTRPFSQPGPYPTWISDTLPAKDRFHPTALKYSRKVFLGGVPWDITDEILISTFRKFGHLHVEWPPIKNGQKPKGYAYIVFDEEHAVHKLLDYCREVYGRSQGSRGNGDGNMYKYHVRSEKMKSKEIQVIPWNIHDSTKVIGPQDKVNMHHQVFVGGLHGMLTATLLSEVMNNLFKNVVYVEIDTDKYKYPLGSGRVNFSSKDSYHQAIHCKYVKVEVNSPKIDKRIQIDPYIRENESCSECKENLGPFYCRSCFDYFCDGCWEWHMRNDFKKHEWVSRQRNGKMA